MNGIGVTFTFVAGVLLVTLPRRYASIPLLVAAMYMTRGQVLEIGAAHFTVIRLLVAVGLIRVMLRGEELPHGKNTIDKLLLLWAVILISMSAFHTSDQWLYRAGMVWGDIGCYFLFRIFLKTPEDVVHMFRVVCVNLLPLSLMMLMEKLTRRNSFGVLGGVNELALVRDGNIRASGPFAHPILAGTVGATCFAMGLYLWTRHRIASFIGLLASTGIVFVSTSSGPVLMVIFIIFGMMLWVVRKYIGFVRMMTVIFVILLATVMNDPVYFLVARIDISGGSQGYFRAQLIRSSIEHLNEWWLAGTDYTRHWMGSGIYANSNHTDITNHFLSMGVMGGLLLMLIFVICVAAAFRAVGRALKDNTGNNGRHLFLIWTLGTMLFGHVVNFMSISLFDQSIIFFYLVLATIGSVQVGKPSPSRDDRERSTYVNPISARS